MSYNVECKWYLLRFFTFSHFQVFVNNCVTDHRTVFHCMFMEEHSTNVSFSKSTIHVVYIELSIFIVFRYICSTIKIITRSFSYVRLFDTRGVACYCCSMLFWVVVTISVGKHHTSPELANWQCIQYRTEIYYVIIRTLECK